VTPRLPMLPLFAKAHKVISVGMLAYYLAYETQARPYWAGGNIVSISLIELLKPAVWPA
jgi:hypothetical protein